MATRACLHTSRAINSAPLQGMPGAKPPPPAGEPPGAQGRPPPPPRGPRPAGLRAGIVTTEFCMTFRVKGECKWGDR